MGKLLSQKQINEYERDGFICPIDVLSEDELLTCNLGIEKFERDTGEEIDFPYKSRCHQIFSWADHLVHHPKILDAVEDVIGPNILCYHATLWVKPAKSKAFVR